MQGKKKPTVMLIFVLTVVGSGLWRYLMQEGGEKGLWFGLVMGGIGIAGAWSLSKGKSKSGLVTGGLAMLFVLGWFCYETLVLKGLDEAEIRHLIVIGVTIACVFMVYLPSTRGKSS